MRKDDYPADLVLEKDCLPIRIDCNGDRAVLCLHGYTSYPGIYNPLVPALAKAGFAVSVPRLPGHGTTGRDFLRTAARDWLRTGIDAYIDLKSRYKKVYIVGQSMGGLMGLILSDVFGPEGLVLLSPAILVKNRLLPLAPFMRFFIKRFRSEFSEQWAIPVIERIKQEYWDWTWIAPAAELLKLIRQTKRHLKHVSAPVLCIMAGKDRTIKPEACTYIFDKIRSQKRKQLILENSVHNIMAGECTAEAAKEIVGWLQSCCSA